MKYSRSGFGSKTSAQPIPFISVKEKYIFSPQLKISCVLFYNLTEVLRKHTAPLIHLACLSQRTLTHMSEKAYCLMIKAKGLGIEPPGLFYRKKKYIKWINWLRIGWNCYLLVCLPEQELTRPLHYCSNTNNQAQSQPLPPPKAEPEYSWYFVLKQYKILKKGRQGNKYLERWLTCL